MIAHIDMDAFFARCEQIRKPELKQKPVVICIYTRNKSSGAVSTSNYKARELGISSGMALREAQEKATDETFFLEADHEYYRRKSEEVMSILSSFTSKIQQTSVDEAYFRLEDNELQKAKKIKAGVESLGLTASIGIAPNKFLAKLASEEDKPDGLTKIEKDEKKAFLEGKELIDLHGVGSKTEDKLNKSGIESVEDLREANNSLLAQKVGREKAASLKKKALGKGSRKLETDSQKQISKIKTMERNSRTHRYIMKEVENLADKLDERIGSKKKAFRKVTVIGIDTELNQYTRSKKIDTTEAKDELIGHANQLVRKLLEQENVQLRRIGLRVSDLVDRKTQMTLQKF
jgi:DNA polymerase IV (DinB-like DNA polymerase)